METYKYKYNPPPHVLLMADNNTKTSPTTIFPRIDSFLFHCHQNSLKDVVITQKSCKLYSMKMIISPSSQIDLT